MLPRRNFMKGMVIASSGLVACKQVASTPTSMIESDRVDTLSAQDLEDALVGSSYLGTGGGGSLNEARRLIQSDLAAGHLFRCVPVSELPDDARVACTYGLASLAPNPAMELKLAEAENRITEPVESAFLVLAEHLGSPLSAVILGEIGPLSLAEGLSIAARLGVPALDADTVGRAVPEINQHSVKVAGIPLTPIGAATPFGDTLVVKSLGDPSRAEDLLRAIAEASSLCGVTDSPISGAQAKKDGVLVTGSLTLARSIGAAVRTAKDAGEDPIAAAIEEGNGLLLFRGEISDFDWRDKDGFLEGWLSIAGVESFAGMTLRTEYKNEHLVAYLDGRVVGTCPDLISVIDLRSYDGVNNPEFDIGMPVAVLGFPCNPVWRTKKGLEVFSPRYFGYDLDYVQIERLN